MGVIEGVNKARGRHFLEEPWFEIRVRIKRAHGRVVAGDQLYIRQVARFGDNGEFAPGDNLRAVDAHDVFY